MSIAIIKRVSIPADNPNANVRFMAGSGFQIRETSPVPGWRIVWLENGSLQFGDLIPD